jgi:acyl-CoA thioesterase-1
MKTPWLLILVIFLSLAIPGITAADSVSDPLRIVVFGDSLTAGYGLTEEASFPAQLQAALRASGNDVIVINAGISGDTTASGLSRLDWSLTDRPDLVIVELGGNDALRGIDPLQTRANLNAIILELKRSDVLVMLAGMRAPRNMGYEYYSKFNRIFPELAEQHKVPLYEFFLKGVAGSPQLNQSDGIHPNREGVGVIVKNILPVLKQSFPQIR